MSTSKQLEILIWPDPFTYLLRPLYTLPGHRLLTTALTSQVLGHPLYFSSSSLFLLILSISPQQRFTSLRFAMRSRIKEYLDLPLFNLQCGFHVRACLVILDIFYDRFYTKFYLLAWLVEMNIKSLIKW